MGLDTIMGVFQVVQWQRITLAGDTRNGGLIPRLGRPPRVGNGNPLQYSCLENIHGQRSLAVHSSWGCKELDTTEQLSVHTHTGTPPDDQTK